jgi:hypothetical protein
VIVCENSKPGTPQSVWDVQGAGNPAIQGFATQISVDHGHTVYFKIDTTASAYHLDIYRLGYYGGDGARLVVVVHPSVSLPQSQPPCLYVATVKLVDCGNWTDSASWKVPAAAVSGIYLAKLVRDDVSQGGSHIVFIVRDDERHADILFQTSDSTWQAYNEWGGHGIYLDTPEASYNRPFDTRTASRDVNGQSWVLGPEYAAIRFLEANGYDVSYAAGVDAERDPTALLHHRVYLSAGHDEYWSRGQRDAVEAARDAGVNLLFLSGNESFWKTRWANSADAKATPYRTLVTYKESLAFADPSGIWTGMWRDPRRSPPEDGGRPENAMSGQASGSGVVAALQVPPAEQRLRFWRNTAVASTPPGETATLAPGTVGYEFDQDLDNGSRPAGLMWLSTTTPTDASPLATHHTTLYRAASGALVFDAGSVQWAWGLDGHHDGSPNTPDQSMRQAIINLLADMHVQPASIQPAIVLASASTDHRPPTTHIATPTSGATVTIATPVNISGTAHDTGGGTVAGVEVSVDNGTTWHPARGLQSWSYTWTPNAAIASTVVLARAVDDSGNLGNASTGVTVTIARRACPCTIWNTSTRPATPDFGQPNAIEVGMKFRVDLPGHITGVRFYKADRNRGPHIAHLWRSDGTLLASASFTDETQAGWQTAHFATPIAVKPGNVYVVSYYAPHGHTAGDIWGFDDFMWTNSHGVNNPPLHALWDRDPSGPNGVSLPGTSGFPTTSYLATNYWVDPIYITG